jgi:hypothetical protein
MNNDGMIVWSTFHFINARDRCRICRIRAKAVDSFGGESD